MSYFTRAFFVTCPVLIAAVTVAAQERSKSLWDGVYTAEQAQRGHDYYEQRCAHCHGSDLTGGDGPSLVGSSFVRSYSNRYLDRLFKKLQERMPADDVTSLNDKEKLDGEGTEGAESIEEYAEFYAELMAQLGLTEGDGEGEEGDGEGQGGRGMGRGAKADEDDSVTTDFKTEQSRSAVTAGKVLLSVKTKGVSDRGDAKQEYRSAIEKVKQGYSEAVLQEQIPPGYHEGIKKYFDNIDKTDAGKK